MTKITYIQSENDDGNSYLKFIHRSGSEPPCGVDSIWYATPDIELSSGSNLNQETLETIKRKVENWEPTFVESSDDSSLLPYYYMPRTRKNVKYLKVRNVVRDAFWYGYNCIPYDDGLLDIESLHPESDLYKKIKDGQFIKKDEYDIIFKNETIAPCDSCQTHTRLQPTASYDEDGEPTNTRHLCDSCRTSSGYTYEDNGTYYDMDIRNKLSPGANFRLSYQFGGIMNYSYRTTDDKDNMKLWQIGKGDIDSDPFLGVELEVAGKSGVYSGGPHKYAKEAYRRVDKGLIACCQDGSLSGNTSFEIKTVPAKLAFLKDSVGRLYKDDLFTHDIPSKNHGYGMHVHVDRKGLKPMMLSKLVTFMNAKENRSFLEFIAGRPQTSYTKYQDEMRKIRKYKNSGGYTDKYSSLNLAPSKTIEFRIFNAPESLEEFCYRLEFCEALLLYCKSYASLRRLSYTDFLDWVLDPKNRKGRYANLIKFLKTVHYKNVELPLNSICNNTNGLKRKALGVATTLEGLPISNLELYQTTLMKLLRILSKQVTSKELIKTTLKHVFYKCGDDMDKFWSVMSQQVCDKLPSEYYFHLANRKMPSGILGGKSGRGNLSGNLKLAFSTIPDEMFQEVSDEPVTAARTTLEEVVGSWVTTASTAATRS